MRYFVLKTNFGVLFGWPLKAGFTIVHTLDAQTAQDSSQSLQLSSLVKVRVLSHEPKHERL